MAWRVHDVKIKTIPWSSKKHLSIILLLWWHFLFLWWYFQWLPSPPSNGQDSRVHVVGSFCRVACNYELHVFLEQPEDEMSNQVTYKSTVLIMHSTEKCWWSSSRNVNDKLANLYTEPELGSEPVVLGDFGSLGFCLMLASLVEIGRRLSSSS